MLRQLRNIRRSLPDSLFQSLVVALVMPTVYLIKQLFNFGQNPRPEMFFIGVYPGLLYLGMIHQQTLLFDVFCESVNSFVHLR